MPLNLKLPSLGGMKWSRKNVGLLHKRAKFWEAGWKTTAHWDGFGQTQPQTANMRFLIVCRIEVDETSTDYFKPPCGLNAP